MGGMKELQILFLININGRGFGIGSAYASKESSNIINNLWKMLI